MLINGEKWACEACVRGHRVSNCQHHDRDLIPIQKKGRPISQCQHCRSERKSRGAHVKCDCGEKTIKCKHLTTSGHRESCCCNHGGRCTCVHKESPALDTVPEAAPESSSDKGATSAKVSRSGDGLTSGASLRRRRANTTASDGKASLTFDENGHHKPTHRSSKSSAKGAPYSLSRVQSMHAATGLSLLDTAVGSRRSRPVGHSRTNSTSTTASSQSRTVRGGNSTVSSPSESPLLIEGSPMFSSMTLARRGGGPTQSPLDFTHLDFPTTASAVSDGMYDFPAPQQLSQDQRVASFDLFSGLSDDQPLFSAGLASGEDWSSYSGLRRDVELSSPWTSGAGCASPVFGSVAAGLNMGARYEGASLTLAGRALGLQPGPGLTPSGTSPDASDAGDLDSSATVSSMPALSSAASSSLRLSSAAGSYAALSSLATSHGTRGSGMLEYDDFLATAKATSTSAGKFGASAGATGGGLGGVYSPATQMAPYSYIDEDPALWIGGFGPDLGGGGIAFSESPEPGARW